MKKVSKFSSVLAFLIILTGPVAHAHYGMIIPSDSMVMQKENRTVTLKLSFSHPFEGIGMELEKPEDFTVMANGKKQDLLGTLKGAQVMNHTAWETDYN
ncbi:MAG: DUF4198 domain-containing protein, partial [Deltaproteobacteria bacterium]|nr:DUF4198 domain-containing protein [Deltaproteobacteria bacterium]